MFALSLVKGNLNLLDLNITAKYVTQTKGNDATNANYEIVQL